MDYLILAYSFSVYHALKIQFILYLLSSKDVIELQHERDSGLPNAQSQDSTNMEGGEYTKEKTMDQDHFDCPYYMIMHVLLR